ncbi:MAG: metallophosphoesterase [Tyzzerella sp.]|nr:metallophosphoesterase [Tyzzerella sp.]
MGKWLILLVVIGILVIIECIREISTFQVTHYEIQSPKLKNIKKRTVILLSDLHNCSYGKENEKLLQAIRKEHPDMILVAGDMLVGKKGSPTEVAQKLMEELPQICATYYANGNHEQKRKEAREPFDTLYQKYRIRVINAGVHYLENEKATIKWEDCDVEIHGLEIPREAYKKFQRVSLPENCLENCLGKADAAKYQILIAHNPVFVSDYLKWGADLIVSGHLHGGIARIPFWRGVITPQGGLFPKYSGELTKEGDASVVVSKGIGIHTIKIRFLNPTELVVLHVGGSEE